MLCSSCSVVTQACPASHQRFFFLVNGHEQNHQKATRVQNVHVFWYPSSPLTRACPASNCMQCQLTVPAFESCLAYSTRRRCQSAFSKPFRFPSVSFQVARSNTLAKWIIRVQLGDLLLFKRMTALNRLWIALDCTDGQTRMV